MPISLRIRYSTLEKNIIVDKIQTITKYHRQSRFILVSYSYESIISIYLLKSLPTALLISNPIILISSISFLLYRPNVVYNFTTRRSQRAKEYQLQYFESKDIGVVYSLARRFFQSKNIVQKEDLEVNRLDSRGPRDITVILSSKDRIIDREAIRGYLIASLQEGSIVDNKPPQIVNKEAKKAIVTKTVRDYREAQKDRPQTRSRFKVLQFEYLDYAQIFNLEKIRRPLTKAIGAYLVKGQNNQ